ncbi:MAG TPA: diacylglycerol kinase family protein [Pirellulales bacterium]|nr:diacylglycerol kinase family protein [Pirellulales bacterium]
MNDPQRFTVAARLRSFVYAGRGLGLMLRSQHNAWLHAAVTFVVLALGFVLQIQAGQWCWIIASIVAVWTAEALNTAFEFLCDAASPDFHPMVEQAKDVAAGGVLISAIGAAAIGLIVFLPYVMDWLMATR